MRNVAALELSVPIALTTALLLSACATDTAPQDTAVTESVPSPESASANVEAPQQTIASPSTAASGSESLYAPWARVLEAYVDDEGLVDYAGLAGPGRADLEAFMSTLADTDPSTFSEPEQMAFWINAYNATTVFQVVEHYPLESVRDVGSLFGLVGGFFKQPNRVAGEERSLDNIEHDILRPTYVDARVHWTLVCASFGCPRLIRRPYLAVDLDALLTEVSLEFMANPRALQIDEENATLWVSSYFDWYGGDFEAAAGDIIDYILQYAPQDKAEWIRANRDDVRVRFMDYDWTLNDQPKGPRSRRPVLF